ncbi:MAG: tetratricopeptide repeat protein, partial [Treponema sp.]|nr:tetratricopeptide repeat protein [Treponema sp.]
MISKTYRQKYAHQCSIRRLYTCFLSIFILIACGSSPETRENPGDFDDPRQQVSGSLTEEIRSLTETGILSSMLQALELIRSRNLAGAEFGRVMNGINTLLIRLVYPDSLVRLPILDLPQTHNYTRIIREAERGVYQQPHENSIDFFEHILPFLAVTENVTNLTELFPAIFDDLKKAERIRPTSIFPAFFQGLLHERLTNLSEAERFFRQAYSISEEFYPALIGIARVRRLSGDLTEAVRLFSDLTIRYPDSLEIKKELTLSLFENRAWQRALPIIDEVLLAEPRNGDFILMKAFILIEQGNHSQANVLLDGYAAINPNNRMYLFLRARIQFEGNRNRDSALNYLRSILRSNPDDEEALGFAATLLLESPRPADHAEGRELL